MSNISGVLALSCLILISPHENQKFIDIPEIIFYYKHKLRKIVHLKIKVLIL